MKKTCTASGCRKTFSYQKDELAVCPFCGKEYPRLGNPVADLSQSQPLMLRQDIHQIKMQPDIILCKALCLKHPVEGIMQNLPAVHGQIHILAG